VKIYSPGAAKVIVVV